MSRGNTSPKTVPVGRIVGLYRNGSWPISGRLNCDPITPEYGPSLGRLSLRSASELAAQDRSKAAPSRYRPEPIPASPTHRRVEKWTRFCTQAGLRRACPLALGPVLAAAADEIERNRDSRETVVTALIDNGLFRLLQPRSLGGGEVDPMSYMQVVDSSPFLTPAPAGVSNRQMAARWLPPLLIPKSRTNLRTAGWDHCLGSGRAGRTVSRPRWVPLDRHLEFRQRQPSRQLAGGPCCSAWPRRRAVVSCRWR